MIETEALHIFRAVAQSGSLTMAATILRLSQPAISRQLGKLETQLGARLFRRHGHGVTLTDAGRVLLERAGHILGQLEQVEAEIRERRFGLSGEISFALPPGAGYHLLPPLMERFSAAHPGVTLKVLGGYSGHIHEWLARGQVDIACIHDPSMQRGFEVVPIIEEQVYLVGKVGSFPTLDHATAEFVSDLPLIVPSRPNATRKLLDSWLSLHDLQPRIRFEVNESSLIRALVRQGSGFTLLPSGAIDSYRRFGELQAIPLRPAAHWRLAVVTLAKQPSEIQQAFVAAIYSVVRELTQTGVWPGRLLLRARDGK